MNEPVFILAGEPSGDRLAASIMKAVNEGFGDQTWIGVGGPAMVAQGLTTNTDMDELTVFGFGAALAAYPRLSKLADRLVDQIMTSRPKLVITVDVKGFSLRLAERLKKRMAGEGWSAPVVHTVAPTVWAWGAWRRHRVAKTVDGLLCLFPFEPAYFKPLGLKADFIGHPEAFNPVYEDVLRAQPSETPHVTLLPGSRRSEISHLLSPMLAAFSLLQDRMPNVTATIPTLSHLKPLIAGELAKRPDLADHVAADTADAALFASLSHSQAVLAASGTVTLQTALYGVPGVACYIAPAVSAFVGRRLVNMDRVILPNALLDREVYPFLFQNAASPKAMADAMIRVFEDGDAQQRAVAAAEELRALLRGERDSFSANVVAALAPWMTR